MAGKKTNICQPTIILRDEKLKMGKHSRIDSFCVINCAGGVDIGDYSCIHAGAKVIGDGGLIMGRGSVIEFNAVIVTSTSEHTGHMSTMIPKEFKDTRSECVIIGDECFIGIGSVIMPGVRIGDRSVIAAHSYVDKDVPANMIYRSGWLKEREFRGRFKYD
jgi:galactoside O-acetyltransferase